MLTDFLFLIGGLALLLFGASWLINGASALARKFRVSELAIGLTVVAFGTSAPELVVNGISSWQGHQDLVFGNVIGSNNFNLLVILGVTGTITPLIVQSSTAWKEIPVSLAGVVLIYILVNLGENPLLSRLEGGLLLVFFVAFLFYVYKQLRTDPQADATVTVNHSALRMSVMIIAGLAGLIYGGQLVVDHAVAIAREFGMTEKMIGLTIIAAGTSLPELVTSIMAAIRKNNDIAVGNIIGSNIFNLFFILGVSAVIRPIPYDLSFNIDLYVLGGGTILLLVAMYTGVRKKLDRWEAILLMLAYFVYMYLVL